ncbi:UNVERIFIED_CONTAM: hypothetical protein RMT77_019668 [Armadillidium vulgare]
MSRNPESKFSKECSEDKSSDSKNSSSENCVTESKTDTSFDSNRENKKTMNINNSIRSTSTSPCVTLSTSDLVKSEESTRSVLMSSINSSVSPEPDSTRGGVLVAKCSVSSSSSSSTSSTTKMESPPMSTIVVNVQGVQGNEINTEYPTHWHQPQEGPESVPQEIVRVITSSEEDRWCSGRNPPPHSTGCLLPASEGGGGVIIRDVTLAAHTPVKQEEEQEEQELKNAYASAQPPAGYSSLHASSQPSTFTHVQSHQQPVGHIIPTPKEEVRLVHKTNSQQLC